MRNDTSLLARRFAELDAQYLAVEATKRFRDGSFAGDFVDNEMLIGWRVKVNNLLAKACGEQSVHYQKFNQIETDSGWSTNYQVGKSQKAVFDAAREDFEGGYLASFRNLVQAELFDSELDQARELLGGGYVLPAAVIAGVVLETTLRQMCIDVGIAVGKLDKMNAELAKAGCYNLLMQKRITALADIRNSAAHGNTDRFSRADVEDMLGQVEAFLAGAL
jgi:hypothetical protein